MHGRQGTTQTSPGQQSHLPGHGSKTLDELLHVYLSKEEDTLRSVYPMPPTAPADTALEVNWNILGETPGVIPESTYVAMLQVTVTVNPSMVRDVEAALQVAAARWLATPHSKPARAAQ
jgi:hypothetical protein